MTNYGCYILANKRIAFDMNKTNLIGVPDGMTVDADGNLWIALFGGNQVSMQRVRHLICDGLSSKILVSQRMK